LNAQIAMSLSGGSSLTSIITAKSVKNMGLSVGDYIYAIIKSSDINIVNKIPDDCEDLNILEGTIKTVEISQDSVEVSFVIDKHTTLTALLNKKNIDSLKIGSKAYAIINKNNIIIGL
ncbi:ModE family transcriptional regulator, partial [Candidatus Parcubacteria bacterium]